MADVAAPPKGNWLEERLGLASIRAFLAHKTVPVHAGTIWYYFGGITLFLFVIQVLTGTLLLRYYRPSPSEAYESVQFIVTRVQFGWLIRSIHSWSDNLMILSAFIHMFSVVFLRAFRRPRELTWLSGIALLGLALAFGFSGYLLPWNTVSYFATKVGTDMAAGVLLVGHHVARFLRGGNDIGGGTLTRFFGFHVAVLPGITTLLLLAHLALVQKHGMSSPRWAEEQHPRKGAPIPQMPFFPNFFLEGIDGLVWGVGRVGIARCYLSLGVGYQG
jgi:cytochrome b6